MIVAQCLYLLCQPFKDNRGSSIVNFLLNYGLHDLSDNEKEFWVKHADILINFLDCMYNTTLINMIIMLLIFNVAQTEKNAKEWEVVLLSTLKIILEECTVNKHWCLALVENMFDEFMKSCENTKILTSELFLMIKLISYVAAFSDTDELSLTKKLLHFIFQSFLKISFENSQVS